MVPKPTIKEARVNRKRFLVKNRIYDDIERKGSEIIGQDDYQKGLK